MKKLISFLLVLTTSLSFSQTRSHAVKIHVEVSPLYEKINLKFSSKGNSETLYKVNITDAKKNILKTVEFTVSANPFVHTISILDLAPGNYACFIYKGKEEVYKLEFFKDAILAEPQPEPVLREPKN